LNHRWEVLNKDHLKYFGKEEVQLKYLGFGVEAYALSDNNEPLFVLVFVSVAPGTAAVTLYPTPRIFERKRKVYEAITEDVEEYMIVKNIVRLQANTKNEPRFISFMEKCGFELETILKKFYNGEDYLSWVMFSKAG